MRMQKDVYELVHQDNKSNGGFDDHGHLDDSFFIAKVRPLTS